MKKYFNVYRNWRICTLIGLFGCSILFILCECSSLKVFFMIKPLGCLMLYATYHLYNYWSKKGEIKELVELTEEE